MALDFQRPDPSSPAAVAAAQFTLSRRGYREEEVRDFLRQVSVEMARLFERERFLESELKAMQARGPIDVGAIDEAAVTELLGAEAARILSVAREAAQAMRDRAAESAEHVVREASREATRLREESSVEASRRRSDVSGEAEQELELAKQQGREMIAEVRAYRERVLTDLAKRTEEARRELERLVHERERLLGAFERARHAATDVVGDLNEFDETLRGTGVTPPLVPPDAPPPPRPTRPSKTPIFDAKQYEHELGESHQSVEVAAAGSDAAPSNDEVVIVEHVDEPIATVETVEPVATVEETPKETVETTKEIVETTKEIVETTEIAETPETVQLAEVVNLSDRRRQKQTPRASHVTPELDAPEHPVFERIQGSPPDEQPQSVTPDRASPAATSRVDEIFARLRTASTTRVANETTQKIAAPGEPHKVDESVFQRRAEVVDPALPGLIRAIKRCLADNENAVLTHVSTKRSTLTLAALLATPNELALQYTEAIRELVTSVAVDAARSHSAARRSDMRAVIAQGAVLEKITEMFVADFISPLHERVAATLVTSAGDRDALLVALRALFAEWKSQYITPVVSDIAYFSYARGLFLGCDTKASVCWAVDPQGPACADAEDNSLATEVRRGDAFPTGHTHPLAHAGCRCLVVPLNK
jgi:DivIVA domain-containing protein